MTTRLEAARRLAALVALVALVALAACGGADQDDPTAGSDALSSGSDGTVTTAPALLSDADRTGIVVHKATCPFAGTAVATAALQVLDSVARPLAKVADVMALGDRGGGDLGSKVLKVFAIGNHARMRGGAAPVLDTPVPNGTFSLDFPGSKGSHPGHSRILESDPVTLDSGRFDPDRFQALLARADADDGHIRRSQIGAFIAANLVADPDSKVFGSGVSKLLGADIAAFAKTVGPALLERLKNDVEGTPGGVEEDAMYAGLTKLLAEDNLVGSSGEYGLLMAFLAQSPRTITVFDEPAVSVDDVTAMFRDKRFPDGWEQWPKTKHDWVVSTLALMHDAAVEYLRLTALTGH
jgi:hypothetical protein